MKENVISLETAKLSKKKGFNLPVNFFYIKERPELVFSAREDGQEDYDYNSREGYSAPTQEVLRQWLEEKNIYIQIMIDQTSDPKFAFKVLKYKHFGNWKKIGPKICFLYKSRQKALEDALTIALKSLKK